MSNIKKSKKMTTANVLTKNWRYSYQFMKAELEDIDKLIAKARKQHIAYDKVRNELGYGIAECVELAIQLMNCVFPCVKEFIPHEFE